MANLKAIRKRIQGVKGTQQLTRAMKLVAAAKLRKAQEAAVDHRPSVDALASIIRNVAVRQEAADHPLMAVRPPQKILLLVFSSDRGMCGSFNLNVSRRALEFVADQRSLGREVTLVVVGKKGNQYLTQRGVSVAFYHDDVLTDPTYARCSAIGERIARRYIDGAYDEAYVLYNWFKSPVVQMALMRRILPVDLSEYEEGGPRAEENTRITHLFEPGQREILDVLFPIYLNMQVYHGLLESIASENGARMTAMDNATGNAQNLIQKLVLQYNRARQDAITTELMDIVNGAEALR